MVKKRHHSEIVALEPMHVEDIGVAKRNIITPDIFLLTQALCLNILSPRGVPRGYTETVQPRVDVRAPNDDAYTICYPCICSGDAFNEA